MAISAFDGMHPRFKQVPPSSLASIKATFFPDCAALMAAGIHRDDVPQGENLAILPHKLPRPVVMPPTPPPAVEPFYQPVDGKPVGK